MQISRFRSIWISDIHLGFKDCKAQFLVDFLESTHSEFLYIVGDFIDVWSLHKGGRWPAAHSRVLQAILDKSIQGTRVIYLPGNHDEVARDYIGLTLGGIEITRELIHQTADGRRFLVTHGDEYEGMVRCGSRLTSLCGDSIYDLALFLNRWTYLIRQRLRFPYWSFANYLKKHVSQAADYIARFENTIAHEAARRGLDGVICGHIHKADIMEIDGVLYCNDGDWVESCTAMVEHPDGSLEILHWADEVAVVLQEQRPLTALANTAGAD